MNPSPTPRVSQVIRRDLRAEFGDIDIYLFDQLLRGNITPGMVVLDVGCGVGRNLIYLLRNGYDVLAADPDHAAISAVRRLAAQMAPSLPPESFRAEPAEAMSFKDEVADVVIASAVLHFAQDERHFGEMLAGMWRVLRPGGLFFARLASTIGIEDQVRKINGRRYALPDGSERFVVDEPLLGDLTETLGADAVDPLKTTVVQGMRAMTTWVLRKGN
jgi:tellurite methyltransferase